MRAPVLLVLLGAAAAAPEEDAPKPSPYAAMGFPVTFNDEIITANDVARFLEAKLEEIDPNTLRRTRDILLFRKINERIAADLSIEVGDREVDAQMKREIDVHGGDAKFYEWLAQQGMTLERFKIERRQQIIDQLLRILFQSGVSHDRTQLLPWRVGPTPREIETAFRCDSVERGGALRARCLRFTVDADPKTRSSLASRQVLEGMTEEEVAAAIEEDVRPRLEAALAALKDRPFDAVAREHGVNDVDAMAKEWITLAAASEAEKFLAGADVGTWSPPIRQLNGAYEIVFLVERESADRKPTDPAVAEEYARRIRSLRATKWEALLRLRALDASTVEPARVREDLREQILSSLREAETALRALGLH